jgi:hypothetical protein
MNSATSTTDESTPSKKRRHVSFAENLVAIQEVPLLSPTTAESRNAHHLEVAEGDDNVVPVAGLALSDRCLAWLAQMEAIDVALSQFQSRQQVCCGCGGRLAKTTLFKLLFCFLFLCYVGCFVVKGGFMGRCSNQTVKTFFFFFFF